MITRPSRRRDGIGDEHVIILPVLFMVAGLLIAVTFVFDGASAASGMASWHSRNALRFPRYYRFMDWCSLSRKEAWWRLWGGVLGSIFFIVGTEYFLALRD